MYAIVSDLHFHDWKQFNEEGKRLSETVAALSYVCRAASEKGAKRVYIAGDFFHARGSWTPTVLNTAMKAVKTLSEAWDVEFRAIPGNHDLETKECTALGSAISPFEGSAFTCVNHPTVFGDDKVIMIPWVSDNAELKKLMEKYANKDYDLIIHAPMNDVIQGIPNHGFDAQTISGFKRVFAGHYHNHKKISDDPEVYSIGALTHQTWNDVGTKAGGLIVKDKSVLHVETLAPKFVFYDFSRNFADQKSICKGNFVKVRSDKSISDSDIEKLRDFIMITCEARGLVFEVRRQKVLTERQSLAFDKGQVSTSAKLISAWIQENIEKKDQSKVIKECHDALDGIGSYRGLILEERT